MSIPTKQHQPVPLYISLRMENDFNMENKQADTRRTAEPVSRDQTVRRQRGQENIHSPCSADHKKEWQPYPADPFSAIFDTYIHQYSSSALHTEPCGKMVFLLLINLQKTGSGS